TTHARQHCLHQPRGWHTRTGRRATGRGRDREWRRGCSLVSARGERTTVELYLDAASLIKVAAAHRAEYAAAAPFPHVVLDGVLPDEMLELTLAEFPAADSRVWREYDNYYEGKLETQGEERIGSTLSLLLYQFNSAPFLRFLEELTGITGLIGDPY